MLKIRDISPAVDGYCAVFPGDTAYPQRLHFSIGPDCPVNVNAITLSPRTGAHADAPLHHAPGGAAAGTLDLGTYLGPCRVIHCLGGGTLVEPAQLAHALVNLPARVLVRTRQVATQRWDDFSGCAPRDPGPAGQPGARYPANPALNLYPTTTPTSP